MPIGKYKDFKDCVRQNQDKENPEGYCAQIEKNITGHWPGEKENMNWKEKLRLIKEENNPIINFKGKKGYWIKANGHDAFIPEGSIVHHFEHANDVIVENKNEQMQIKEAIKFRDMYKKYINDCIKKGAKSRFGCEKSAFEKFSNNKYFDFSNSTDDEIHANFGTPISQFFAKKEMINIDNMDWKEKLIRINERLKEGSNNNVSQLRADIRKYKRQLIQKAKKTGIYENFGQDEVRKLKDKYDEYGPNKHEIHRLIMEFNDWAMNFNDNDLAKESYKESTGKLSKDASDILDGIVVNNKTKPVSAILTIAKNNPVIKDEIVELNITNKELTDYIKDTLRMYSYRRENMNWKEKLIRINEQLNLRESPVLKYAIKGYDLEDYPQIKKDWFNLLRKTDKDSAIQELRDIWPDLTDQDANWIYTGKAWKYF